MKRLAAVCVLLVFTVALRGEAVDRTQQVINLHEVRTPISVMVPEGQDLDVVLENIAPSASYRVSFKKGPRPPQSSELTKPFDNGFSRYVPSPGCADLKQDGLALIAAEDEAQVVARVRDLRAKIAASPCPDIDKRMLRIAIDMTRRSLRQIYRLIPGEELTVTVERLSAPTKAAARTWTATFRGGAPDVGWKFPNEQAWIVHEVSQDILEMVRFAETRSQSESMAVSVKAEAAL